MDSAHKHKNKGFSLIELLVASSISFIALAVVTSVFLKGYTLASQRSLQLMLAQDTNDVLRMMKEDILRAGYAAAGAGAGAGAGASSSLVISGASKTVYLASPSAGKSTCIAYGFDDGTDQHYRSYYFMKNKLNIFATKSSVLAITEACKNGHSALNYLQMNVLKFEVIETVLSAASTASQYLTINLEVATLDGAISSSKSVNVKIRNWN